MRALENTSSIRGWEEVCKEIKITPSLRAELIKDENFAANIMGDDRKALVSTPE